MSFGSGGTRDAANHGGCYASRADFVPIACEVHFVGGLCARYGTLGLRLIRRCP